MALFKISKGLKANLPATYNEGYCYFTTDDGKFYIDTSNAAAGRICLNANAADKLTTSTAGDSNTPVYFQNGIPVACTSLDLNTTGYAHKLADSSSNAYLRYIFDNDAQTGGIYAKNSDDKYKWALVNSTTAGPGNLVCHWYDDNGTWAGQGTLITNKTIDKYALLFRPSENSTLIPSGADLNTTDYLEIGTYWASTAQHTSASPIINCPVPAATGFMMIVQCPDSKNNDITGTWIRRIRKIISGTGIEYIQNVYSGSTAGEFTYTNWRQCLTTGDNYAGSASPGGSATSAVKLDTATAGDSNTPVYFTGGKPVACTSLDLDTSGNAATANKVNNSLSINGKSFDGSAAIDVGVIGAAYGGTGKTTLRASCNALINALETGSSAPQDADYYISQYAGGGTTTTTYHRRPMSALWSYIKGKSDSTYVNVDGDTMTGNLTIHKNAARTIYNNDTISMWCGMNTGGDSYGLYNITANKYIIRLNDEKVKSSYPIYGAVWNDYAEFRNQTEKIQPGYCVTCGRDGKIFKTSSRLQYCEGIVSDTFGFGIGETEECKTPLAVSGRVLAYYEGDLEDYEIGDAVCASINGLITKMTREEIMKFPDRIIGTVSEFPTYETWGDGNVPTKDRIWIKVK